MRLLNGFHQIKSLGHPARIEILRYLMNQPATLSQLGAHFNQSAAHIRHHIKILEKAGFVTLTEPPPNHKHLEKYYRATSEVWLIQEALLPEPAENTTNLVMASKDIAVLHLVDEFAKKQMGVSLHVLPFNSLDGLILIRQGICQMATSHLKEPDSDQYNHSFIRHLFPGQSMAVITMYHREEGLIVRPGNPLGIRTLDDLARPGIKFVNRERGSGIRLWLDQTLKELEISPERFDGYNNEANSHAEVAQWVQKGQADVGLGIAAAARSLNLDFIPLFNEPYELAVPSPIITDTHHQPFFDLLNSRKFRSVVQNLDGYIVPYNSGQLQYIS